MCIQIYLIHVKCKFIHDDDGCVLKMLYTVESPIKAPMRSGDDNLYN